MTHRCATHAVMPSQRHAAHGTLGFTLLELMITVAIVAILTAIAVSSYQFATVKTRRNAAEGCLLSSAQYMERFYTTNMVYDKDTAGNDVVLPACSIDVTSYYDVRPQATAPTTYTLEAVPKGSQASDTKCATLTVDQTGKKGATGPAGVTGCW